MPLWGPFGAREPKAVALPGGPESAKSIETYLLWRMARGGIEPPTCGFSVLPQTDTTDHT
jgi:hypothetical protein